MCVSYETLNRDKLKAFLNVSIASEQEWKTEVWQDYLAPIVVGHENGRQGLLASYGMLPKKHMPKGAKRFSTVNARAETIGMLRSYATSWMRCQFCLVPMSGFFEFNYESGKAERWKVSMADESPFAVAGIFRTWQESDEMISYSYTQITINADEHPLMRRFYKPEDEKRSLVIVPSESYDDWLNCRNPELARSFLTLYPADLMSATVSHK